MHCISVDSERAAGTIKCKTFKQRFSRTAAKWFDNIVDKMAIGHLTEGKIIKHSREEIDVYYYKRYIDSIGNSFLLWAYKKI